jgi:hypothetical protein
MGRFGEPWPQIPQTLNKDNPGRAFTSAQTADTSGRVTTIRGMNFGSRLSNRLQGDFDFNWRLQGKSLIELALHQKTRISIDERASCQQYS